MGLIRIFACGGNVYVGRSEFLDAIALPFYILGMFTGSIADSAFLFFAAQMLLMAFWLRLALRLTQGKNTGKKIKRK